MKSVNSNSIVITAVVSLVFGLALPTALYAATTPSLGAADTFGILAGTFTNTAAGTTINGDVGYTTGPAVVPTVNGTIYGAGAPTPAARTDAGTALTNLDAQACTFSFAAGAIDLATDTTHGTIGVYTPGVYCTTGAGAASIGAGGITLSGAGTYIFRVNGALTSVANSNVTLANGASSCDVFWTPTAATTLGANTTFKGTIIDNANAITIGNLTSWIGRALSLGAGTITTDANTITRACSVAALTPAAARASATINVVKVVINDGGGVKTFNDFPIFVNGMLVVSGVTNIFPAPAPVYRVTETYDSSKYTQTFSGDCDSSGQINLNPGENKFCIVTNNDIAAPIVPIVPPLIDVVKVPSPLALPLGPGQVMYTYTLRNVGTVPVTNITMVGDTCSPVVLVSGDTNNDAKLDVTETWVHTCTTTLSETHTNTVVATGWANGISAVDIASATVVVGLAVVPPLIHVTKIPSPLALPAGGGMVMYTKMVTNPGTVPLSNVRLTDNNCSPLHGPFGDANNNNLLDPNEAWAYACQTKLTKTTVNTVFAEGSANGLIARDFAVVTVVVAVPKLPNTGIAPDEKSIPWNIVMFSVMFILITGSLIVALKKQKI